MKSKLTIIVISICILAIIIIAFIGFGTKRCVMDFATEGKAVFRYGDSDVSVSISNEHLTAIKAIFNNKVMYRDTPSCGFSEDVAVVLNESQTFCIARDTCPVVYWKEQGRYISLCKEEKEELYRILEEYDFIFPCV